MSEHAGRVCPIRYRYGAEAIARLPEIESETLYVVGGLYGNVPALDAIEAMAVAEAGPVSLIFNGDFNWFNIDDAGFEHINRRVLAHHSILGNVEAELGTDGNEAGCGCAYPDHVDSAVVERSNRIHQRLKQTAAQHPQLLAQLQQLPMIARFVVGGQRIGVVHGDADTLAGWRFDAAALSEQENQAWITDAFNRAGVDVFASTHTCLPALHRFGSGLVANNGAAGMPNFKGLRFGLLTRISTRQTPFKAVYGEQQRGVYVDAVPVHYDHEAWLEHFMANWPTGSDAWASYFHRIQNGPKHGIDDALRGFDQANIRPEILSTCWQE
ncbi:hypothetical protein [Castellaniella sp. S9]|uniref:hypothetical protein n=1 Tax=Castellaniella sp. S9 TaxID=2993652 RepID=UPI0022B54759|nr:hypothetical protein [Castellaniella sp. S9]